MEIKIGSANDNDIILDHPSVGRHHALVTIKDDKHFVLRDLKSKNGTRVNDRRIRQTRIHKGDEIFLGELQVDNDSFFSKIKELHNETRKDFTEEYIEVFKKLKEYEKKKDKIMKAPLLPILLRIGLGVLFILILIFFPNLIKNTEVRYVFIIFIGILSTSAATFVSRSSRKRDTMDRLRLEYEDALICPKCGTSLINHTLTYLLGKGKCINSRCDATYEIKP